MSQKRKKLLFYALSVFIIVGWGRMICAIEKCPCPGPWKYNSIFCPLVALLLFSLNGVAYSKILHVRKNGILSVLPLF